MKASAAVARAGALAGVAILGVSGSAWASPHATAGTGGSPYAGYVTDTTTPDASISATFVVPKITCESSTFGADEASLAITGETSSSAYEQTAAYMSASCSGTTPSYTAFALADLYNQGTEITVSAGDTLTLVVTVGASSDSAVLTDTTTTGSSTATGSGFVPATAEAVFQAGGGGSKFPKFTAAKFSSVMVDGSPLGASLPMSVNETNKQGKTVAKPSGLTNSSAFKVSFVRF